MIEGERTRAGRRSGAVIYRLSKLLTAEVKRLEATLG